MTITLRVLQITIEIGSKSFVMLVHDSTDDILITLDCSIRGASESMDPHLAGQWYLGIRLRITSLNQICDKYKGL
jgi:hypothetical protein